MVQCFFGFKFGHLLSATNTTIDLKFRIQFEQKTDYTFVYL